MIGLHQVYEAATWTAEETSVTGQCKSQVPAPGLILLPKSETTLA